MISILTNNSATSALQTLRSINSTMGKVQVEVSSGLKIGAAEDNAAYWSISTTMRSDNKAIATVADALGLGAAKLDIAYQGLQSTIAVLDEFKAKLVAAAEPGVDKSKVQKELEELKAQVRSIAGSSSFNGVNWLSTDISDIYDSELNKTSLVSSFTRNAQGNVAVHTTNIHLSAISLFNENGGGLLQEDPRNVRTIGGLRDRFFDTNGVEHMSSANYNFGSNGAFTFNFSGPVTFGATDTMTFDVTVDKDNPADGIPGPYDPGTTTTNIIIDRAMVDTLFPAANGVISTYTEYSALINHALGGTGAYSTTYTDYQNRPIIDRIGIETRETSGHDGSYVEISNFTSTISSSGFGNASDFGYRGSTLTLNFEAFEVFKEVEVSFNFHINGEATTAFSFDRDYVNTTLGVTDGKVQTSSDMVTLLNSLINRPEIIIQTSGANQIIVKSDENTDRASGNGTGVWFTNINVNIEPIPTMSLETIDIVANSGLLKTYIRYIDTAISGVIDAAAQLGAVKSRVSMQSDFVATLTDTIDKGIGRLVDANMNQASTRLKAMQTQEQLAIQALSIANSEPQNILRLFQA